MPSWNHRSAPLRAPYAQSRGLFSNPELSPHKDSLAARGVRAIWSCPGHESDLTLEHVPGPTRPVQRLRATQDDRAAEGCGS